MEAVDDVRRRVFVLTTLSVVALLAVSTIVLVASLGMRADASRQTDALRQLTTASSDLDTALSTQDISVRRYAFQGDGAFLDQHAEARDAADDILDKLERELADEPGSDADIELVRERLASWRREVADPEIEAIRSGDLLEAFEIERTGLGAERLDQLRSAQRQLGERIQTVNRERLASISRSADVLLVVAGLVAAFAVVYGVLSSLNQRRWGRQRREAEAERAARELAAVLERRWIGELATLSAEVNRTDTVDRLVDVVARGAAQALGADYATVGVVDRTGELRIACDEAFEEAVGPPDLLPMDGGYPLAVAIRDRTTLVFGSGPDQRSFDDVPLLAAVAPGLVATTLAAPLVDGSGRVLGGLVVHWRTPTEVDATVRSRFDTLGSLATEAIRRGRLYETSTALAELSADLAGAPTVEDVGGIIAEHGWRLADARTSNMAVVDAANRTLRFYDPTTRAEPLEIPIDAKGPINDAVRTGERTTIGSRQEFEERYPEIADAPRWAGIEAAVVLPIVIRGRVMAAIGVGWARPIVSAVDEAALATLAELARGALERAVLYSTSSGMSELAGRLAEATTGTDVGLAVDETLPAVLGASLARLAVRNQHGRIDVVRPPSMGADSARFRDLPLEAEIPLVDVIRTGREVLIDDRDEFRRRYPGLVPEIEALDVGALWAVPLLTGRDPAIGAIAVAWPDRADRDPATRALLATVADLCGATLERTQRSELEHELVSGMTEQLVRMPPGLVGVECAGRYQPALSNLRMGGDWYEFIALEDGRTIAVVGDVVGHGVDAAIEMARFRTTIATLIRTGVPFDDLFPTLHPLVSDEEPTAFRGTALCIEIDPRAGTLRLTSAGHPPALLRTDAGVRVLEGSRYPPLGMPPDDHQTASAVPFEPGDVVVSFTDGLVESRRAPIDDGIASVAEAFLRLRGDVESIADALVTLSPEAEATDDVAVVVVRRVD
ncbi:SpoIIE family protein phosphatase [Dermatobacter hominis]|uniref:SpoIIE family protein phosphatase n=1 Tax=Dermatobacter hominis TaxID=2884263 RepID=UPI001D11170A|nr:SpoIIE family protein phosphatase [Dermatobacter hominis]UDY35084.1 SpoIIE family protein phosphatase [Dermatobacter hominis]